jgi:hypothetical protein
MKLAFLIIVVLGFYATSIDAQSCISPRGFNPNICEFTASDSFVNDIILPDAQKCITANSNPFAMYPPMNNAPQNQAACNTALQGDGTACVNAYAKYQCASKCATCGKKACLSICTVLPIACPSAAALNCFQLSSCATGETNCVNYAIDSSEIPPYTTTTRATTTTPTTASTATTSGTGTTTTTATTTTTTSESAGSTLSAGVAMLGTLMVVAVGLHL